MVFLHGFTIARILRVKRDTASHDYMYLVSERTSLYFSYLNSDQHTFIDSCIADHLPDGSFY